MSVVKVPELARMLQNSVMTHDGMSVVIPMNVLYRLQIIAVTGENIILQLGNAIRKSEEENKKLRAQIDELKNATPDEPQPPDPEPDNPPTDKKPVILAEMGRKKH